MFLGALVDAGVSADLLRRTVAALNVGAELEISRVLRNGIGATKVDVIVNGEKDLPREEFWARQHDHSHEQEHAHEHRHNDGTVHSHAHEHGDDVVEKHSEKHAHRGLKEIRAIITGASIPESVKATALKIFQELAEAEGKIHNTDAEKIHFHEVGAVDAIVDIVCAAVGADSLGIDEWHCSPLNVGGGIVHCAHGTLPVPAPATLELLRDAPIYSSDIRKELVTPTGAAIVAALANHFGSLPLMTVEVCGYGAGSRDLKSQPNVLRLTIGDTAVRHSQEERRDQGGDHVTIIEASIDDATPQVLGYVLDRLMEDGALDAFAIPAQMKKNRPGALLTTIAHPEDAKRLAELIFTESTTIGLRMHDERRLVLGREWKTVETEWGNVRIKTAQESGREMNAIPEFEDCRRIAMEHRVPLKQVMQEAMRAYFEAKQKSRLGTHK